MKIIRINNKIYIELINIEYDIKKIKCCICGGMINKKYAIKIDNKNICIADYIFLKRGNYENKTT
jgi:hypothetical protein